jgi:hypothetical protein
MNNVAQLLCAIADKAEEERAQREVEEMHKFILTRASELANQGLKHGSVNVREMHKLLGYVDYLADVEYYFATDRYHQENKELRTLLVNDGFRVCYANTGDAAVIHIYFAPLPPSKTIN